MRDGCCGRLAEGWTHGERLWLRRAPLVRRVVASSHGLRCRCRACVLPEDLDPGLRGTGRTPNKDLRASGSGYRRHVGGLGFASAEIFAKLGASVIVTVRTEAKGEAAVRALERSSGCARGRCSYVLCDFLDNSSIRRCAATLRAQLMDSDAGNKQINFLILNAGIARVKIPADVWQTSHVGPWLFAEEIEPLLSASDMRIVWVSSGAHKKASINFDNPFDPPKTTMQGAGAYGQSKLANILHMREYPKRHAGDVRCFAITPGFARTRIMTPPLLLRPLLYAISRSPTLGAQVIKMACLDDNLKGGEYLSNCYVKPTEGQGGSERRGDERSALGLTARRQRWCVREGEGPPVGLEKAKDR